MSEPEMYVRADLNMSVRANLPAKMSEKADQIDYYKRTCLVITSEPVNYVLKSESLDVRKSGPMFLPSFYHF
ncbi:hypothetical protein HanIR_Chr02g0073341 [Helianthus annuus]|nr:hypothetical protein HanIR_Chr02g0073341 [Helianthus annuus]